MQQAKRKNRKYLLKICSYAYVYIYFFKVDIYRIQCTCEYLKMHENGLRTQALETIFSESRA